MTLSSAPMADLADLGRPHDPAGLPSEDRPAVALPGPMADLADLAPAAIRARVHFSGGVRPVVGVGRPAEEEPSPRN